MLSLRKLITECCDYHFNDLIELKKYVDTELFNIVNNIIINAPIPSNNKIRHTEYNADYYIHVNIDKYNKIVLSSQEIPITDYTWYN